MKQRCQGMLEDGGTRSVRYRRGSGSDFAAVAARQPTTECEGECGGVRPAREAQAMKTMVVLDERLIRALVAAASYQLTRFPPNAHDLTEAKEALLTSLAILAKAREETKR